jgi:hypothetical protein
MRAISEKREGRVTYFVIKRLIVNDKDPDSPSCKGDSLNPDSKLSKKNVCMQPQPKNNLTLLFIK